MCVNWIVLVEIQYLLKKEPSQDKKIRSTCKTYYANKGMRKKNTSEKWETARYFLNIFFRYGETTSWTLRSTSE
jgi:hypothetical protein